MKVVLSNNGLATGIEIMTCGMETIRKAKLLIGNNIFSIEVMASYFDSAEILNERPNARYTYLAEYFGFGNTRNNVAFGTVVINLLSGNENEFLSVLNEVNMTFTKEAEDKILSQINESRQLNLPLCREIVE